MSSVAQKKAQRNGLLNESADLSLQSENLFTEYQLARNEAHQARLNEDWKTYNNAAKRAKTLLSQSTKAFEQANKLEAQANALSHEISMMMAG